MKALEYVSVFLLGLVVLHLGSGFLRSMRIVSYMLRAINSGQHSWPGPLIGVRRRFPGANDAHLCLFSEYLKRLFWVGFIIAVAAVFLINTLLFRFFILPDAAFRVAAIITLCISVPAAIHAAAYGNKVQALCPIPGQSPIVTYVRAMDLLENDEDHEYAEKMLRTVLERDPRFFRAYTDLALIAGKRGEAARAEEYARKAIALSPRHGPSHYFRGCALRDLGKIDEALESFEKALKCPSVNTSPERWKFREHPEFRQNCEEEIARIRKTTKQK